jgi:hypothetical protein
VSLPPGTARRVKSLAKSSRTSTNRILVELVELGLEAREQERRRFFELADRLAQTRDPEEQSRLKEELARMTFGEYAEGPVDRLAPSPAGSSVRAASRAKDHRRRPLPAEAVE